MPQTDVVVVGAGVGGLTAAVQLADAGVRVTVVEARSRTGGRLVSTPAGTAVLDLGASWWWPGARRVHALLGRFGLATFAQQLTGDTVFEDTTGVQRLAGNLLDRPAGRYAAGADSLTTALAQVLPPGTVHLDEAVSRVELSSDEEWVVAVTGTRTWSARHVVLGVPPVLTVDRIAFAPDLDPELAAVAAATPVWMGRTTKVVSVFPEPFWRGRGLAGAAVSRVGPLQEIHDMSGPNGQPAALLGFAPPVAAVPGLEAVVRDQLVRLFGDEAASVTAVHVCDCRPRSGPALRRAPLPPGTSCSGTPPTSVRPSEAGCTGRPRRRQRGSGGPRRRGSGGGRARSCRRPGRPRPGRRPPPSGDLMPDTTPPLTAMLLEYDRARGYTDLLWRDLNADEVV